MKLDRETIITEALALLNDAGFEEVSLRKLAGRVGAKAPSLARHVGDKANLLALMSHRVFNDALDRIPTGLSGKAWFVAYGRALRDQQRATRDIGALIGSAPVNSELIDATQTRLERDMAAAGLDSDRAWMANASIQALVTGWTSLTHPRDPTRPTRRATATDSFDASLEALIDGFGFAD